MTCGQDEEIRVRMDGYTRLCLTAIAVLLTVLMIGLWADKTPQVGQARAEGSLLKGGTQAQLIDLVKAQQKTNTKLSELIGFLKSGKLTVQMAQPEVKAKAKTKAARGDKDGPIKRK